MIIIWFVYINKFELILLLTTVHTSFFPNKIPPLSKCFKHNFSREMLLKHI